MRVLVTNVRRITTKDQRDVDIVCYIMPDGQTGKAFLDRNKFKSPLPGLSEGDIEKMSNADIEFGPRGELVAVQTDE